jgi:hypothetical protein
MMLKITLMPGHFVSPTYSLACNSFLSPGLHVFNLNTFICFSNLRIIGVCLGGSPKQTQEDNLHKRFKLDKLPEESGNGAGKAGKRRQKAKRVWCF